ncbi:hypothetical protein CBR_g18849 [Chara braunii]|uniref:Uncharacterized protein n=1 Tax=Chara braunii TaxID=69332 RepID=A0A388KWM4_CHABU|nr:hypothetical protein CBR_g18849 [Chara braunii]|eukprot:GBG74437.1 hypothetical protein CBR_g18849 [Chara braunii]
MIWAASCTVSGWEAAEGMLVTEGVDRLLSGRREEMERLLHLVRFPLMPRLLLTKLVNSSLASSIAALQRLLAEALDFVALGEEIPADSK